MRLDHWLVEKRNIESLKKSQALILSGKVLVNERVISHAGFQVGEEEQIRIKASRQYYSRSALKLKAALKTWNFELKNKNCFDIGSSHGGFTQVLLEMGAHRVISLDLAYGQLHPNLRNHERVFVMERKNIYHITENELPFRPDIFTADLSFTRLEKLIVHLKKMIPQTQGICLFKPQFEADKAQIEKGIVKDENHLQDLLKAFKKFLSSQDVKYIAHLPAAIKGRKGNQEYLFWISL